MSEPNGRWQVDRHIPLALILTIMVQTGTIAWWASGINFRVGELEQRALTSAPQAEKIIRLETKLENIAESLTEIKNLLRARKP